MAEIERVVLWDIDGTLGHTAGVGAQAFITAVEALFGVAARDHGVTLAGKTDPQIAREILAVLELHDEGGANLSGLVAEAERLVAAGRDEIRARGRVFPGVREALGALNGPGTVQTVLTGNTAANAAVKLDALGLAHEFDLEVGAYGSDDADRNVLVPVALERIERRYGPLPGRDRIWVVGDTPLDGDCARAGGVRCLLVASGFASRTQLEAAGADRVLDDLTDTGAVVALLGRGGDSVGGGDAAGRTA